jgi:hypothetical protein
VTPLELVERARAEGLTLEAAGDRLRVRPKDRLTPKLRAALIEQKPAILRLLGAPDDPEVARREDAFRAPLYAFPWPNALPDLGPRRVQAYSPCADCGSWTWVAYGPRAFCFACARRRSAGAPLEEPAP